MDTQQEFLRILAALFDKAGIPYMIAGSIGSSFYGQPRATNDIDIVVDTDNAGLKKFLETLEPDYYVNKNAAMDALNHRSMFNIIDNQTGWKVDVIIRKSRPFSQEEFRRRQHTNLMGLSTWLLSPEDSILSKLEWTKNRESTSQLRDVLGVLIAQWDRLDFEYLKKWAPQLEISTMLDELTKEAQRIRNEQL
jgi:hypothetical protein